MTTNPAEREIQDMGEDLGVAASPPGSRPADGAAEGVSTADAASIPNAVLLDWDDCETLIQIPRALRLERGWNGARSVGMAKLIEERLSEQIEQFRRRKENC